MKKLYFLTCLLASFSIHAQDNNITFSVDMTGQSFTQAYVSGSFNSWSGESNPLSNVSGNIWEATLPIPQGEYEYKFTFDNWTGQEAFTQGDVCTITNYGNHNRRLVVNGSDKTLATAPFGVCAESATNPGPHDVTISVDMTGQTFTNVYISGEFNGWSGTSNQLIEAVPGSGIYSSTFPLDEGSYQFKITTDDWAMQEGFNPGDPGTSTDGTYTNRYMQIDDAKTYDLVWNSPEILSIDELISSTELSVFPNPSKDVWNISSNQIIESVFVYDVLGKQVMNLQPNNTNVTIDATALPNGLYFARMVTELGSSSTKLIKQ